VNEAMIMLSDDIVMVSKKALENAIPDESNQDNLDNRVGNDSFQRRKLLSSPPG